MLFTKYMVLQGQKKTEVNRIDIEIRQEKPVDKMLTWDPGHKFALNCEGVPCLINV
jgi:hypothetical protein